jgi:enoyl-CoA hydratase/carnithine racemase
MTEQLVTYELQGDVALIGLDRADKRNAINKVVIAQLREAAFRATEEAKAGVIFGHGDNFSAGLDLTEAATWMKPGAPRRRRGQWNRSLDLIARGQIPFVAALKGACIGGGLEIAAAAHVRIADETTFFALPEGQRGIFVGGGGSVRLPRLIGVARMTDMMLTGRVYSATEGAAYGFSQYLTEAGGALPKALELAERVAANAPLTNFAVLQALPMIAEANPQTGLLMESLMATVAQSDKEAKRRIRAFLDRKTAKVKPT